MDDDSVVPLRDHPAASSSSRSSSSSASDGTRCHCETRQVTASSSRWSGSRTVPGGTRSVRHRSTRQETHDASGLPSGRSARSARSRCPCADRTRSSPRRSRFERLERQTEGRATHESDGPGGASPSVRVALAAPRGGNRTRMCTGSGAVVLITAPAVQRCGQSSRAQSGTPSSAPLTGLVARPNARRPPCREG